jgi:small subunit ribosomal protein S1
MLKYGSGDDVDEQEQLGSGVDRVQASKESTEEEDESPVSETMDVEALEASLRPVRPGDVIEGTIVEVSEDGVVVHVGGKYEGVIPTYEFPSSAEIPGAGEKVSVAVIRISDDEGQVVLSKKKADYENVWLRIQQALETGEAVTAMVTERVKGGLRVDLGVSGFVPASQVSTRNIRDLDRFVGRSLRLRVIEADRRQKKVILSHRQVVEEDRQKRREDTMARLREGMVCEGKVRNITDYGAFVDLGGVDGLLHISEMAWTRIKHPSEVVKVGDTIQVAIIGIDRERNRISLSRRECMPDPWNEVAKRYSPGSIVKATITRLARNGAFARLEDAQIEGFVPISELAERRISEPGEVVSQGQVLDLKIISLRPEERRMTLSLAEAEQEKERQEYRDYIAGQKTSRPTLGDQFGDILSEVQTSAEGTEEVAGEDASEEPGESETPKEAAEASEAEAPAEESEESEAREEAAEASEAEAPAEESEESEATSEEAEEPQ